MALRNDQYEQISRIYDRRRLQDQERFQKKLERLHKELPELEKIQAAYRENSAKRGKAAILGNLAETERLEREALDLKERKKELLASRGLTEKDLEPAYFCPDCRDTGYIQNRKCHCFLQLAVDLLYDQSRMKGRLEKENFDTLSFDYYSTEHPEGKRSQLEQMEAVIRRLLNYVNEFDKKGGSLLFYGPTGTGKTFLTNCIAKALMDTCHSVVYFSAIGLFEEFEKAAFGRREEADGNLDMYIMDSDLLIIDDLGTERANAFTVGKLFQTVNERALRNKSTIISMNLDPNLLAERYTERVASRILSDYDMIRLEGADIRIAKKYGAYSAPNKQ